MLILNYRKQITTRTNMLEIIILLISLAVFAFETSYKLLLPVKVKV